MNTAAFGIGAGAGLGAALMYLFDQNSGKRRRALLRDKAVRFGKDSAWFARKGARDFAHRAKGVAYESKHLLARDEVSDEVLVERVRSALGRASQHPGSIEVTANKGVVTLSGPILQDDHKRIVSHVRKVRGVNDVRDQLDPHEQAGNISQLQGGAGTRKALPELLQENWTPAYRIVAGGLGAGLLFYGIRRGDYYGIPAGISGAALLFRGIANKPWRSMVTAGD
jgi:hypothetical protein